MAANGPPAGPDLRLTRRLAILDFLTGPRSIVRAGLPAAQPADAASCRQAQFDDLRGGIRLRAIAERADQPLLILDRRAMVVFASAKFASLSGLSGEELIGRPFSGLFKGGDIDDFRARLSQAPADRRIAFETDLVGRDGNGRPVTVVLGTVAQAGAVAPEYWAVVGEKPVSAPAACRPDGDEARRIHCAVLAAQEAERKRIASDLHDGLGQMLSAVRFRLQSASAALGDLPATEVRGMIDGIAGSVKDALEEVRRLSLNLRPSILDDLGVLSAVSWFVREFHSVYRHIEVDVAIGLTEPEIPERLRLAMFRVIQEGLNNVAKHSRATRVVLRLEGGGDRVRLTLADNGVGFDPAVVAARPSGEARCGHCCSRDRVESLGGRFAIETGPGRGVKLTADWPLQAAGLS